jgi:hypothetical protein
VEPKDKFAKPEMETIVEIVVRFLGGIEEVVRLRPKDSYTLEADNLLIIKRENGEVEVLYLNHAVYKKTRQYEQVVRK